MKNETNIFDSLETEFDAFLLRENLPDFSAEELLHYKGTSETQKAWLRDFLNRWDSALEAWPFETLKTIGNLLEAYTLTAHEWHKAFNADSPSQYALDDVCHILRERLEKDWGLTVEEINKRSEAIADELGLA